jgi:hypothetical protein
MSHENLAGLEAKRRKIARQFTPASLGYLLWIHILKLSALLKKEEWGRHGISGNLNHYLFGFSRVEVEI